MVESGSSLKKNGGWTSFSFIIGANLFLTIAGAGSAMNLIVYLIEEFNFSSVDAAQVFSILAGTSNLLPLVAAIIADSFLGCFIVASVSSCISLLGIVLLMLTALVDALRPHPCSSSPCPTTASKAQLTMLYSALSLAALGVSGLKFTIATIGANQFHKPDHQATFFNWFAISQYAGFVVGFTVIIYVQDNIGWGLGFGLCAVLGLVGTVVLVSGNRFYHHVKPQGSPFMDMARVVVAAIKKRRFPLRSNPEDYNCGLGAVTVPSKRLRFFNHAALKTEVAGDTTTTTSDDVTKKWSVSTVQQVEDLKTIIRIIPVWSCGILLATPLAVQSSTTVLQALLMDRHLGPHFNIPAGTLPVLVMISGGISIVLYDRVLNPVWLKFGFLLNNSKKTSSVGPLKRIGLGHVLNILGMVVSALVESKRLHSESQLSVFWLFPQLIFSGVGEGFHFPGQVALYYQGFPASLKGSATSLIAVIIGIAYYLSSVVMDVAKKLGWLKDDINKGRLDLAYWMLAVIGAFNFGYFLICATQYQYPQNIDEDEEEEEEEEEYSLNKQEAH